MEEVSQSTSGRKLLDELGFIEQGLYWVNNTDSKYLKIFKTDFDLAFRNYQLELLK